MFYRARFDNAVGVLLQNAGIRTTDAKLEFWPSGESAIAIEIGQLQGLKPEECAGMAVRYVYEQKRQDGTCTEELYFPASFELFEKEVAYFQERDRRR